MTVALLPERHDQPVRLGRHVEHDERSRNFPAAQAGQLVSVMHKRHGRPLDQGQIGSCTGNALVNCLRTEPTWAKGRRYDEKLAVRVYELATTLDGIPGEYPPTDTGSSGLGAAKAAQQLGLITSYSHTFSGDQARHALVLGPVMQGTEWTEAMFHPDADGRVHPTGAVAGGHEYAAVGLDVDQRRTWYWQSWGGGWGVNDGSFYLTWDDQDALLAQQGDVTVPQRL